jgi:hypothetical protein
MSKCVNRLIYVKIDIFITVDVRTERYREFYYVKLARFGKNELYWSSMFAGMQPNVYVCLLKTLPWA